jgi:hypothetical protein
LIVATDARGVYEFARASTTGRSSLPVAILTQPAAQQKLQATPQQKLQTTSQQ